MNIEEAQRDWRTLDDPDFVVPAGIRLISHEPYDAIYTDGLVDVEEIRPNWFSRCFAGFLPLFNCIFGLQLLFEADNATVVIVNGSTQFGNYVCLLNYYVFLGRKVILFWDSHVEPKTWLKRYLARKCFLGCSLATLWSARQPANYAGAYGLPENLFIFIPYKATHSKVGPRAIQEMDFVFSGGNGKRDYEALVKAVRGTEVIVIVSATRPEVIRTIGEEPNVIPLAADEPSYAKLMAASRFVVIPMVSTGLKGGGESNYCNAMWHGKPIIALDDVSAEDYIEDGKTGYVVKPGNWQELRRRILELWRDPERCRTMGARGQEIARKHLTQVEGIRRLVRLACLLGGERCRKG